VTIKILEYEKHTRTLFQGFAVRQTPFQGIRSHNRFDVECFACRREHECIRVSILRGHFYHGRRIMSGQFGDVFDLSGFLAVPSSLKLQYQDSWNVYNRIQIYNSNVSTIRGGGDKTVNYYTYVNYDEANSFTLGLYLHVQRYPTSNWNPVSKD
jgi:hypothetical protein